jgi:WD40 repeat protein
VWSPDGQQLVSASDDKKVNFWDAHTGHQIGQPCTGHTGWIYSLAISPGGSFIATASDDKTVRLWSTETYQQIAQEVEHTDCVRCVAISPNGALLASGSLDWGVSLWSIETLLRVPVTLTRRKGWWDQAESQDEESEEDFDFLDVGPVLARLHDGATNR